MGTAIPGDKQFRSPAGTGPAVTKPVIAAGGAAGFQFDFKALTVSEGLTELEWDNGT